MTRSKTPLGRNSGRRGVETASTTLDDQHALEDELPGGLLVRRQGESLETVSSKAGEIRLLVSEGSTEVIEGVLGRGERITLTPAAGSVETYYLLEGALRYDPSGERRGRERPSPLIVGPGDHIVTKALAEPVTFVAQRDVRFLYVTSQPIFHEVSQKVGELMRLSIEVEVRDGYTAEHCYRLQALSYATGRVLGLPPNRLYLLNFGAYLHDVGKIKVPAAILQKPAALTPDEWAIIKKHPTFGRELLESTFMSEAGAIVEQHHERSDGSGYPYGLSGDAILVEASIVAVADTYDAMTTDRPYRRASSPAEACAEIRRYAGRHYPVEVVEAFFEALRGSDVRNFSHSFPPCDPCGGEEQPMR